MHDCFGIVVQRDTTSTGTCYHYKDRANLATANMKFRSTTKAYVKCSGRYEQLYWFKLIVFLSKPSLIYYFKYNLGCTWIQKDGYYVEEGHTTVDECYDTLQEAKEKCLDSQDCHVIATQKQTCGGRYRVSHGGPTFKPHWMYDVRAWEHYCRGNDNIMRYSSYCECKNYHRAIGLLNITPKLFVIDETMIFLKIYFYSL